MALNSRIPSNPLLSLHAAVDGKSWWKASQRLLAKCFDHHFLVGGFSFRGDMPMVLKRTKPAPERDMEWWARNAAMHPLMHLVMDPSIKIHRVTETMSVQEIKTLDYYHEFMKDEGWLYSVGMFFRQGTHMIGMLAVNRREDQGEFTEDEMALFHDLHPHFDTAIQRVTQVQVDRASTVSMAAMLSRIPLPVAIVSWQGELLYINDAARRECLNWSKSDGQTGNTENLSRAVVPAEVLRACTEFASKHQSEHIINHPPEETPLVIVDRVNNARKVMAEPLTDRSDPMTQPAFLLRFETTSHAEPTGDRLENLAKLSTAEQAVTVRLLTGDSNREIATALGKSEATVKKQLESIYRKLGVHDRRRLMTLLR